MKFAAINSAAAETTNAKKHLIFRIVQLCVCRPITERQLRNFLFVAGKRTLYAVATVGHLV